jgi:hypothetical protein
MCSGAVPSPFSFFFSILKNTNNLPISATVSQLSLLNISYFMVEVAFAIQTTDIEKQKKKIVVTGGT